jgi:hypothetical protein
VTLPLRGGVGRRFARPVLTGPPASGAVRPGVDAVTLPLRGGVDRRFARPDAPRE